jgi:chromosome segregation ATPase
MKSKFLLTIICSSLLFVACQNETETSPMVQPNENQELLDKIEQLQTENEQKDSLMVYLVSTIGSIQDNLNAIAQRGERIKLSNLDERNLPDLQEGVIDDISYINDLLSDNKKQISQLRESLKKAGNQNSKLENVIEALEVEIVEKNLLIEDLLNSLADNRNKLDRLSSAYTNRIDELGFLTEKLNTAYYTFGSRKELIENNIIDREGGVLGIGRRSVLSNELNKKYFAKIDISEVNEIKLFAKKAELITVHPEGSYKFENGAQKLIITDSEQFWSVARYLVIEVTLP